MNHEITIKEKNRGYDEFSNLLGLYNFSEKIAEIKELKNLIIEKRLEQIIYTLTIKNAKRKLEKVSKICSNHHYQMQDYPSDYLSKKLFFTYKRSLPDPYLDDMVEQAKVLKMKGIK